MVIVAMAGLSGCGGPPSPDGDPRQTRAPLQRPAGPRSSASQRRRPGSWWACQIDQPVYPDRREGGVLGSGRRGDD